MAEKAELLNRKLDEEGPLDLDQSLNLLEDDHTNEISIDLGNSSIAGPSFEPSLEEQDLVDTSPANLQPGVVASPMETSDMAKLTSAIVSLTRSVDALNATMKRKRKADAAFAAPIKESGEGSSVTYESENEVVDLAAMSGSRPSTFAINMAKRLFSNEELAEGMISPQKSVKTRKELSPRRTEAMKSAVKVKFGNGHWQEERGAINKWSGRQRKVEEMRPLYFSY